jgi:hypothetical protein
MHVLGTGFKTMTHVEESDLPLSARQDIASTVSGRPAHRIAVIGFGAIGRALAEPWITAGHRVTIGSRNPAQRRTEAAGADGVAFTDQAAAIAQSTVVALCVPHAGLDEVLRCEVDWTGKVVLDATNPVALSPEGRLVSTLATPGPVGVALARRLPAASVVRAFSHVMDELLVSRGRRHPGVWAVAMAGDDEAAKQIVAGLIRDTGFVPVDLGGLADSAPLDPGGLLFPSILPAAEMRVRLDEHRATHRGASDGSAAAARGGGS